MSNFDDIKKEVLKKINIVFEDTLRFVLNTKASPERIRELKNKYKSLPNDELANILTKRASRKNGVNGVFSGAIVTGAELVALTPIPEPMHKGVAVAGTVSSIIEDATVNIKIQMQLVMDIAELYGVPYNLGDEEDFWLIFKAALGIKGNEKILKYAGFIFNEAAKKQFRKILRMGIRAAIQKYIIKVAGQKVGFLLAEKYVIRLIPVATMIIGGVVNSKTTQFVGKWAKIRAKIRSVLFKYIDEVSLRERSVLQWILPLIYHIGTYDENFTDNDLVLYSYASKRIQLEQDEFEFLNKIMNDDDFEIIFYKKLSEFKNVGVKKEIFKIALVAASVNFEPTEKKCNCLKLIAECLDITFHSSDLDLMIEQLRK